MAVVSLCSIDPQPTALSFVSCLLIDACTSPAPHAEITGKKREQRRPGRVLPPARLGGCHPGRCPRPRRRRNCRLRPARPGHSGPASFRGPCHREKSGVSASGCLPWPAERRAGRGAARAGRPGGVRAPRLSLPPARRRHAEHAELCAVVPICCESTRARVRAPSLLEGKRPGHGWPAWAGLARVAPGDS